MLAALADWKCDLVQGSLIAKPMSEAMFTEWLQGHRAPAATSR